jgi:serine phosphatase RsbU (regulator of sigma subunit)/putative methionine-R-sulfoxide reductase with GAF domain
MVFPTLDRPQLTAEQKLQSKLRELEFLTASSRALNATLDLDQLLDVIVKLVREAVDAEAVSLLFIDDAEENLVFELARGRRDNAVRGLTIPVGEGVIGWVAQHRKSALVNDTRTDPRYSAMLEKLLDVRPRSILAVPLMRRGRLVGVLDAIDERAGAFTDDHLAIATALGEHIATAAANARLYAEARRKSLEYSLLADVGADFGRSLTRDEALGRILANLQKLIPFDAAAVFLFDRDKRRLESVLHQGYPRGVDDRINLKSNEGVVGQSMRRKRAVIVDDVRQHDSYVDARPWTRAEMVVPMVVRGEVIGMFNLESDNVGAYSEKDRELLEAFAVQATVAIERAHLYEQQKIKNEIEEELAVARTVQGFFTPQQTMTAGRFKICGVNFPSLEVSGDYVDYFGIKGGRVAFAIADVAGKGVPASLIMSSFRATLHTLASYHCSALQITRHANEILLQTVRPQDFVTAFIGVLDPASGEVTYCNAGHNPPLLMAPDGSCRPLEVGGPLLGVFEDLPLDEGRLILRDEVLLCYTDGATEARNAADEEYGEERLADSLRRHLALSPYRLGRALRADLKAFYGSLPQSDDVTYLAIRRRGR